MTMGSMRLATFVLVPALSVVGITAVTTSASAVPTLTCQSVNAAPNQTGSYTVLGGGCTSFGSGRMYVRAANGGPTYDCASVLTMFSTLTGRIIAFGSNCTLVRP